jgi:hypothetical protein
MMPLRKSINDNLINDGINLPPEVERTLTVGLEAIVVDFGGGVFVDIYFGIHQFRVLPGTTV